MNISSNTLPPTELTEGSKVLHPKFGTGVVTKIRPNNSDSDWICHCEWDKPVTRKNAPTIKIKIPGMEESVVNPEIEESKILASYLTPISDVAA